MAKTDKTPREDIALERFFSAARAQAPAPGADLLARIAAGADAEIAARARVAPPAQGIRPAPGIWAVLLGALGGWPAVAGLATATIAGVWIGYAGPEALSDGLATGLFGAGQTSYGLDDLAPGMGELAGFFEES